MEYHQQKHMDFTFKCDANTTILYTETYFSYKSLIFYKSYFLLSYIFLTNSNDNVDKVKLITDTKELNNILSKFFIT